MSHGVAITVDLHEAASSPPLQVGSRLWNLSHLLMVIGAVALTYGFLALPAAEMWGRYWVNTIFFTGLACGGVMIAVIVQIVKARWSLPLRRLAEANVSFLPWAYLLILGSIFGAHVLFPWAREPMPGREWWMQEWFVYTRFGLVLLPLLFFMMWRFVKLSLRRDIIIAREHGASSHYVGFPAEGITADWKGKEEHQEIEEKLAWNGPLLVLVYAVIYSLLAFEMVMAMDVIWFSNMYGGFLFVGNIYIAWAALIIFSVLFKPKHRVLEKGITSQQFWDLGKLTFGFAMLWGYLFFSQFLPQWYGNLPEETQWLILRTREYPWKAFSWFTFACAFVVPFIILVSEDVKRVPKLLAIVGVIVWIGVWCEKYVTIMPQITGPHIPFGIIDVGVVAGFLGLYLRSIFKFLETFPVVTLGAPALHEKH